MKLCLLVLATCRISHPVPPFAYADSIRKLPSTGRHQARRFCGADWVDASAKKLSPLCGRFPALFSQSPSLYLCLIHP